MSSNEDNHVSYPIPTETMPSLDLTHQLEDLREIRDFIGALGISTDNTRLDRYIQFYEEAETRGPQAVDATAIFKNSLDPRFRTPGDWILYLLREVHELMWITRGLKQQMPRGVHEKLQIVVGGRDFAALDKDSRSRDAQFELRMASYFCQSGFDVDMSRGTDILAQTDQFQFFVECKRIGGVNQIRKRLSDARGQLQKRMPRKDGNRIVLGCIAADVTKVAFSHNGLTFGMTNDHSRDVIQNKLVEIVDNFDDAISFKKPRKLLCYWLQIHIASLILKPHPPTPGTRFSSYHIARSSLNRREARAVRFFRDKFGQVSVEDDRAAPPQRLTPRQSVTIPKRTTFSLDEEKLRAILERGVTWGDEVPEVFASLTIDEKTEEFTSVDISFLPSEHLDEWRDLTDEQPGEAAAKLIAAMYLGRYPYEPSTEEDR